MQVTDIASVPLGYDVADRDWEFSSGRLTAWNVPLVRVGTDAGHVGWGEANFAFGRAEDVAGVLDRFADGVLGCDPADVDGIVEGLRRRTLTRRLEAGVLGALELALYDVLGQARGVPVYELLGGAGTDGTARAYGSGGLGETVEARVEQAAAYAAEGFDVVKIRGMPTTDGTRELVERAAAELPDDTAVAVDDTGCEGLDDVLELVGGMNTHADRIAWFEDPAPSRLDLEAYRQLRGAAEFPVTGMESCVGMAEFERALAYDPVDTIHPDATRSGYGDLRRVTAMAGARDVGVALHVWGGAPTLLANAHYAAADPRVDAFEYCRLENPLRESFLPDGFERDGTRVTLPDDPGFGLEVPADAIERYPYEPGTGHVGFG